MASRNSAMTNPPSAPQQLIFSQMAVDVAEPSLDTGCDCRVIQHHILRRACRVIDEGSSRWPSTSRRTKTYQLMMSNAETSVVTLARSSRSARAQAVKAAGWPKESTHNLQ